ncbi:hypothetical protein ACXJJ3_41480 [Kribbella sp. WER1]
MAAGLIFGGVALAISTVHRLQHLDALLSHHEEAVGRVIAKTTYRDGPQGGDKHDVVIGFTASDGSWHTTTQQVQLWSRIRNVGDTVTIRYASTDPANFITSSVSQERAVDILCLVVAALLVLGTPFAYVWLIRDTR